MNKYLSIKTVGHDYVKAWKNKDKKPDSNEPDFKGDGVAVWVFEYEDKKKEENSIPMEDL